MNLVSKTRPVRREAPRRRVVAPLRRLAAVALAFAVIGAATEGMAGRVIGGRVVSTAETRHG